MPGLTPETSSADWAQIRYAYEHTGRPIEEICAAHGISSGTLRDRMRRWGWKKRRPPIPREGPPAGEVRETEVGRTPLAHFTSPLGGEVGTRSVPGEGVASEVRSRMHPHPPLRGDLSRKRER